MFRLIFVIVLAFLLFDSVVDSKKLGHTVPTTEKLGQKHGHSIPKKDTDDESTTPSTEENENLLLAWINNEVSKHFNAMLKGSENPQKREKLPVGNNNTTKTNSQGKQHKQRNKDTLQPVNSKNNNNKTESEVVPPATKTFKNRRMKLKIGTEVGTEIGKDSLKNDTEQHKLETKISNFKTNSSKTKLNKNTDNGQIKDMSIFFKLVESFDRDLLQPEIHFFFNDKLTGKRKTTSIMSALSKLSMFPIKRSKVATYTFKHLSGPAIYDSLLDKKDRIEESPSRGKNVMMVNLLQDELPMFPEDLHARRDQIASIKNREEEVEQVMNQIKSVVKSVHHQLNDTSGLSDDDIETIKKKITKIAKHVDITSAIVVSHNVMSAKRNVYHGTALFGSGDSSVAEVVGSGDDADNSSMVYVSNNSRSEITQKGLHLPTQLLTEDTGEEEPISSFDNDVLAPNNDRLEADTLNAESQEQVGDNPSNSTQVQEQISSFDSSYSNATNAELDEEDDATDLQSVANFYGDNTTSAELESSNPDPEKPKTNNNITKEHLSEEVREEEPASFLNNDVLVSINRTEPETLNAESQEEVGDNLIKMPEETSSFDNSYGNTTNTEVDEVEDATDLQSVANSYENDTRAAELESSNPDPEKPKTNNNITEPVSSLEKDTVVDDTNTRKEKKHDERVHETNHNIGRTAQEIKEEEEYELPKEEDENEDGGTITDMDVSDTPQSQPGNNNRQSDSAAETDTSDVDLRVEERAISRGFSNENSTTLDGSGMQPQNPQSPIMSTDNETMVDTATSSADEKEKNDTLHDDGSTSPIEKSQLTLLTVDKNQDNSEVVTPAIEESLGNENEKTSPEEKNYDASDTDTGIDGADEEDDLQEGNETLPGNVFGDEEPFSSFDKDNRNQKAVIGVHERHSTPQSKHISAHNKNIRNKTEHVVATLAVNKSHGTQREKEIDTSKAVDSDIYPQAKNYIPQYRRRIDASALKKIISKIKRNMLPNIKKSDWVTYKNMNAAKRGNLPSILDPFLILKQDFDIPSFEELMLNPDIYETSEAKRVFNSAQKLSGVTTKHLVTHMQDLNSRKGPDGSVSNRVTGSGTKVKTTTSNNKEVDSSSSSEELISTKEVADYGTNVKNIKSNSQEADNHSLSTDQISNDKSPNPVKDINELALDSDVKNYDDSKSRLGKNKEVPKERKEELRKEESKNIGDDLKVNISDMIEPLNELDGKSSMTRISKGIAVKEEPTEEKTEKENKPNLNRNNSSSLVSINAMRNGTNATFNEEGKGKTSKINSTVAQAIMGGIGNVENSTSAVGNVSTLATNTSLTNKTSNKDSSRSHADLKKVNEIGLTNTSMNSTDLKFAHSSSKDEKNVKNDGLKKLKEDDKIDLTTASMNPTNLKFAHASSEDDKKDEKEHQINITPTVSKQDNEEKAKINIESIVAEKENEDPKVTNIDQDLSVFTPTKSIMVNFKKNDAYFFTSHVHHIRQVLFPIQTGGQKYNKRMKVDVQFHHLDMVRPNKRRKHIADENTKAVERIAETGDEKDVSVHHGEGSRLVEDLVESALLNQIQSRKKEYIPKVSQTTLINDSMRNSFGNWDMMERQKKEHIPKVVQIALSKKNDGHHEKKGTLTKGYKKPTVEMRRWKKERISESQYGNSTIGRGFRKPTVSSSNDNNIQQKRYNIVNNPLDILLSSLRNYKRSNRYKHFKTPKWVRFLKRFKRAASVAELKDKTPKESAIPAKGQTTLTAEKSRTVNETKSVKQRAANHFSNATLKKNNTTSTTTNSLAQSQQITYAIKNATNSTKIATNSTKQHQQITKKIYVMNATNSTKQQQQITKKINPINATNSTKIATNSTKQHQQITKNIYVMNATNSTKMATNSTKMATNSTKMATNSTKIATNSTKQQQQITKKTYVMNVNQYPSSPQQLHQGQAYDDRYGETWFDGMLNNKETDNLEEADDDDVYAQHQRQPIEVNIDIETQSPGKLMNKICSRAKCISKKKETHGMLGTERSLEIENGDENQVVKESEEQKYTSKISSKAHTRNKEDGNLIDIAIDENTTPNENSQIDPLTEPYDRSSVSQTQNSEAGSMAGEATVPVPYENAGNLLPKESSDAQTNDGSEGPFIETATQQLNYGPESSLAEVSAKEFNDDSDENKKANHEVSAPESDSNLEDHSTVLDGSSDAVMRQPNNNPVDPSTVLDDRSYAVMREPDSNPEDPSYASSGNLDATMRKPDSNPEDPSYVSSGSSDSTMRESNSNSDELSNVSSGNPGGVTQQPNNILVNHASDLDNILIIDKKDLASVIAGTPRKSFRSTAVALAKGDIDEENEDEDIIVNQSEPSENQPLNIVTTTRSKEQPSMQNDGSYGYITASFINDNGGSNRRMMTEEDENDDNDDDNDRYGSGDVSAKQVDEEETHLIKTIIKQISNTENRIDTRKIGLISKTIN